VANIGRFLRWPLSTDAQDARFAEHACAVAGVVVFPLGLLAAIRMTATNGELLVAVLATATLSLQLVLVGLVAGRGRGSA